MKFQILNIIKILSGFLNDVSTFLRESIHNIIKKHSVNEPLFEKYFRNKKNNIIEIINSRGVLGDGLKKEINTNSRVSFELSDLKKGIHYITLSFIRDESLFNEDISSSNSVIINICNKDNETLFSNSFGVENKVSSTSYEFIEKENFYKEDSSRSMSRWYSHSKSETISYTEVKDQKSNDFQYLEGLLNVTVSGNSIDKDGENKLLSISSTFRDKPSVKRFFYQLGYSHAYFGYFTSYNTLTQDDPPYQAPHIQVLNQRLKIRNGGKESSSVEKKVIKIKLTKDCEKLIVNVDFKEDFYKNVFLHNVFIPRKNVK